ncbi:MAG TPA: histidine kinase [Pyrinomonadaceae bacterium]|nr:histidine kinase [Pyrinomonadaceae bacterium]
MQVLKVAVEEKPWGARLWRLLWLNVAVGVALALVFWLAQRDSGANSFSDEINASLIHAFAYGSAFGLLMPYLGERLAILRAPWNWISMTGALLLVACAASLVVELCLLGLGLLRPDEFWAEYFFKSVSVFFIALVIGLCIHAYENFRDQIQATNLQLRTQELEKERVLKLATEASLASLESRLHPHFLFNTLNTISALISENPPLADMMVQRLASLLRASLDACHQRRITLADELKLVADYLEIEQARCRERLSYKIELEPGLESLHVPPLILQPVVENSIKFAVLPRPEGGRLKISARRTDGRLELEVWDDGAGFGEESIPLGRGLDNLRARLSALFGDAAQLSIGRRHGGTVVSIQFPLDAAHRS